MGTLVCARCGITAEAENKVVALSKIDHAANSKKCDGKDDLCNWYPNGVPTVKPAGDIDPKRPFEGVKVAQTVKVPPTKSAPKPSRK